MRGMVGVVTPVQAWESFAVKAVPRRAANAAGATTWLNWTQYSDHGPDEAVLGEVRGKRVLELGSGSGCNLAHLATLGAHCVGVDIAPTRTTAAGRKWGHLPAIEFVTADVVDYLNRDTAAFDIVYSIFGAVWFTEPDLLLPLVRKRMTPGGILAFSHLPANDDVPKPDRLITKVNLPAARWRKKLADAGFGAVTADVVPAPVPGKPGTLLITARREG